MRLNYYRFPEGTPDDVMIENGCQETRCWLDDKTQEIRTETRLTDTIGGLTVTAVKQLIKKYGGTGWTEHLERDGGCFEVTQITLSGNNSRFTYNHHI